MKQLTSPRMDRCIGCHSCSLACARIVYDKVSWNCAGIRIESAGGLSTGFRATRCLSCEPAPCAEACPTSALRQRQGGGVIARRQHCIRCGNCVAACPVDAIHRNGAGEIFVCIQCGRCVPFCPQNCLDFASANDDDGVLQ